MDPPWIPSDFHTLAMPFVRIPSDLHTLEGYWGWLLGDQASQCTTVFGTLWQGTAQAVHVECVVNLLDNAFDPGCELCFGLLPRSPAAGDLLTTADPRNSRFVEKQLLKVSWLIRRIRMGDQLRLGGRKGVVARVSCVRIWRRGWVCQTLGGTCLGL